MIRFWKFNAFVGTVGVFLLFAAFFGGEHIQSYENGIFHESVTLGNVDHKPAFIAGIVGVSFVAWQAVMTFLGLLVGFFRAPERGR